MSSSTTDRDLYAREPRRSWPRGRRTPEDRPAPRSSVSRRPAAVFPNGPERGVFNNVLLDRDLPPSRRAAAVDSMHELYTSAGVDHYAAWVHESDEGMRAELIGRGYSVAESTRAMGMPLDASRAHRPRSSSGRRACRSPALPPARRGARGPSRGSRCERVPRPHGTCRRRERCDRDRLRPRWRLRRVQRRTLEAARRRGLHAR